MEFIRTSEGKVVNGTSTFDYVYNLKDHLGNVRVSFSKDATVNAEIVQQDHYYPFGMRMANLSENDGNDNNYLYNSKEFENDHDLSWYHYGARYYDPQICRWLQVDPADEFFSAYVYCGNNPVNFVDPDGKETEFAQYARIMTVISCGEGNEKIFYESYSALSFERAYIMVALSTKIDLNVEFPGFEQYIEGDITYIRSDSFQNLQLACRELLETCVKLLPTGGLSTPFSKLTTFWDKLAFFVLEGYQIYSEVENFSEFEEALMSNEEFLLFMDNYETNN